MHATVSHFELPAQNVERAASFYRSVFGWRLEARAWGTDQYFTLRTPEPEAPSSSAVRGAIQGGIAPMARLGASSPLLMVHVSGTTLAVLSASIEAAGGTLEGESETVGEEGEFARFRDSEGNLLGLWLQ